MIVTLPIRLESVANLREHYMARARRTKSLRKAALAVPASACRLPAVVTLTRIAPRALDDDNLASAFKGLRDGIADRFGVADNNPGLSWRYDQRRGTPNHYAVEIEIQGAA